MNANVNISIPMVAPSPAGSSEDPSRPLGVAVVIGRLQIFHIGHQTLTDAAFRVAERVIIVLGSSFRSRNTSNPFISLERKEMIDLTLTPEQRARVSYLPVRDYYDDERWNRAVVEGVLALTPVGSEGRIGLVGYKKDATSQYLDNFPSWTRIDVQRQHPVDATGLRDVYFGGEHPEGRMAVLKPWIHPAVAGYLQAWSQQSLYADAVRQHLAVAAYRKQWGPGPFLTGDAIVTCTFKGKRWVLLVKRKAGTIGEGLWACPGGFLEPGETFYRGAVRELREETRYNPLAQALRRAFKGMTVFDHPRRSPRAHLVTGAHHFDLGQVSALPEVHGSDDVDEARWWEVEALPSIEDKLFEDHGPILDNVVGLFPA